MSIEARLLGWINKRELSYDCPKYYRSLLVDLRAAKEAISNAYLRRARLEKLLRELACSIGDVEIDPCGTCAGCRNAHFHLSLLDRKEEE